MARVQKLPSPNRDSRTIPVEFLVLHYTAVDLQHTINIFMNPDMGVSAHLVIDTDGAVYELVNCLDGQPQRAWHAGVSQWQQWQGFNDFAIGIELVNYNGNIFEFTDKQYSSLKNVVTRLKPHYPALQNPERILGHEHIAGFRGKADPGHCFDWPRFYRDSFGDTVYPDRQGLLPKKLQQSLKQLGSSEPSEQQKSMNSGYQ